MSGYIKTFESWSFDVQNSKNILEAEIPWATEETTKILEGKMSEIDILAQESETFEAFVEKFKTYAAENTVDMKIDDDETKEWLQTIYNQAKSSKDI